jgi:tetratricopeptide (TPR) repeat protein
MKLTVLGIMLLIPLSPADEQSGAELRGSQKGTRTATPFDLSAFATDVPIVEEALGKATGYSREDALVMYGRSSAASGRFDVAAAAYSMFLNEFGTDHPYSERIAVRLADCLFPFKYDQIDVVHTASGPKLEPSWRVGYAPRPEYLRQAVHAFELAASLAQDANARGSALLKLGWVHRVLGDWDTSTAAWDRCASDAAPTKSAADALWLAAENLEWTNRPAEAAEHLTRLSTEHPQDDRVSAATERIEYLQAEARRSSDGLADPVASLKSEIEARAGVLSPQEVYRSVTQGSQRRGQQGALIAVNRWACDQTDWPMRDRVIARFDLADALIHGADQEGRQEAVQRLREIVEVSPDDAAAVHAAIQCCRVLNELERQDEVERMMVSVADRVQGSKRWEPLVLSEHADWLLKRGDGEGAMTVLKKLAASYRDYDVAEKLEAAVKASRKEGK